MRSSISRSFSLGVFLLIVAISSFLVVSPASAIETNDNITKVTGFAFVGDVYVKGASSTVVIVPKYVPNLSKAVCDSWVAANVGPTKTKTITIRQINEVSYTSYILGSCVQMFTPVADNIL